MRNLPTKRVRSGIEYLSLRVARKQHHCEAKRSVCAGKIEPGDQYVFVELPPGGEMGNSRWWHIPVCAPCGKEGPAAERLFGYAIPVTEWLIWSNHHKCWWGPNGSGYRSHIADAGRYAEADIAQWLGRGCGCCQVPEVLIPAPAVHVLTDPETLRDYAEVAPKRATRAAVQAGRVSRWFDPTRSAR